MPFKRICLFVCGLAYSLALSAQENLIPNPGFEEYHALPDKDGCFNDYIKSWSNLNNKKGYPNATPDFLHKKGTNSGKVDKYYYAQVDPLEGEGMMGVIVMPKRGSGFYEYVCAPLVKPLRQGKRYEVSFYLNNGTPKYCKCSARGFGLYFSQKAPFQQEAERVSVEPQIMIEENLHTQTWQKISFRFTADNNYTHMTVGYFPEPADLKMKDISGGSSDCVYFFVDKFSLVEIPNEGTTSLVATSLPEGITQVTSKIGKVGTGTDHTPPSTPVLTVAIQVKDKKTNQAVSAHLSIMDLVTQKEVGQITLSENQKTYTFPVPDASKRYGIFAQSQGYLEGSENIDPQTLTENKTLDKTIFLSPIRKGESIVLKNIYFETAKADLRQEAYVELDKLLRLMQENPKLVIEIQGHTDSDGDDARNLDLSRRRAESLIGFLQKKGITTTRLKSVGYGETKPIATNDTPEGKQQNRRVELKILEN